MRYNSRYGRPKRQILAFKNEKAIGIEITRKIF